MKILIFTDNSWNSCNVHFLSVRGAISCLNLLQISSCSIYVWNQLRSSSLLFSYSMLVFHQEVSHDGLHCHFCVRKNYNQVCHLRKKIVAHDLDSKASIIPFPSPFWSPITFFSRDLIQWLSAVMFFKAYFVLWRKHNMLINQEYEVSLLGMILCSYITRRKKRICACSASTWIISGIELCLDIQSIYLFLKNYWWFMC